MVIGSAESCIYGCVLGDSTLKYSAPSDSNPRWFTIFRRPTNPNPNPKVKSRDDNVTVSVTTRNYSPKYWWNLIAVGFNIYTIGGFNSYEPSSKVFVMECGSHIWREAPRMQMARRYHSASVLDGKIKWEHVPVPDAYILKNFTIQSLAIEGNLYLFGEKFVVYKPKENRWDAIELETGSIREEMRLGWTHDSFCVIDNILYFYSMSNRLEWYDSKVRSWKVLKGVAEFPKPELPNKSYYNVRLVNYGGEIGALWEKDVDASDKMIWCGVIALERRNGQEIYGKVEWCGVVHRVPKSCVLKKFVAATQKRRRQRNDVVQAWHGRQRQRAEELRLMALKIQCEAYRKLVKESKGERLTTLVELPYKTQTSVNRGTPIQNSLQRTIFNSIQNFEEWFNASFTNRANVSLTDEEELLILTFMAYNC